MVCSLEIEIAPSGSPDGYRVSARSSTGGEASGILHLDVARLLERRRELQATLLASSGPASRGLVSALEAPVREVGEHLFTALFCGPIYGRYAAAAATAQQRGEQLRVVLRLRAPELAALPWEMLFDPETEGYLCQQEPLIRHVQVPVPPPPTILPPLRVLGVVSAPDDLERLDTDGEKAVLAEALADLGDQVQLRWAAGARWSDLQRVLQERRPWHALHFIGHGGFDHATSEGSLALEDDDGHANWVSAARFTGLLGIQVPPPRLVVLNSCASGQTTADDVFSSTASALVRSGAVAAIAMQFAVTDPAAKAFAAGFYQGIATNRSISEAVRVGRIGILGSGRTTLEWVTPVLYLRGEDTVDTPLFTVSPTSTDPWDTVPAAEHAAPAAARAAAGSPGGATAAALQPQPGKADPSVGEHPRPAEPSTAAALDVALTAILPHPAVRSDLSRWGWDVSVSVSVAFSPDGRLLATGSADRTGRLWDLTDLDAPLLQATLTGHLDHVWALAFSPDGRLLATASADNTTRLWDLTHPATPVHRATLAGHADRAGAVAFSPDGRLLATGCADNRAVLYKITRSV